MGKMGVKNDIITVRGLNDKHLRGEVKRLVYAPRDLYSKLVASHRKKKSGLIFHFGLPFRQRDKTYKLQGVNWLPLRTIVS